MKKVIEIYFCNIHNNSYGWCKEFSVVEGVNSRIKSIKARIACVDGVERYVDFTTNEFENQFNINLAELLSPAN